MTSKTFVQHEPAAIWAAKLIVFDKSLSNTQNVILSHGRFALIALVKKIDHLYDLLKAYPLVQDFYPHHDIPDVLTEICLHQGIASNIMFNNSSRAHNESATSYSLRIARYRYVTGFCGLASVTAKILSDRKIRNTLIHLDDHLVKAMRVPDTGWSIDSAQAYRDQFTAPPGIATAFCRTFIASEEIILHLGHEISVRKLREEASNVLAAVFGTLPTPPPEPPYHSRLGPRPAPGQTGA